MCQRNFNIYLRVFAMKNNSKILLLLLSLTLIIACESEKRFPLKGYFPITPGVSENLEAAYFWIPQDRLNSSYWKDAKYVTLTLKDISTKNIYADGYLNVTGTYNGTKDFNNGINPEATIKAGYDDKYLYLLVEWKDTTANPSYMTWLWEGPEDDLKSDSSTGWTSQRNNDNFLVIFENTDSESYDVWKWSLAYTAPFDMAYNLKMNNAGDISDPVENTIFRNSNDNSSRTGPKYEWNGERQEIVLADESIKIIDPAYYIYDENKMEFKGDITAGENVFNIIADCKFCHGLNGNGISGGYSDGGPLNHPFTNTFSREGLEEFIASRGHEGSGTQYWGQIKNSPGNIENLLGFLRGIAGTPGQILLKPKNIEVSAISNISIGGIEKKNATYKVLLKRKLEPKNTSDIAFDPKKTYNLSLRFSDNDEINFIGTNEIKLIFNRNEL